MKMWIIKDTIKNYGRYFEGGKLVRHAQQPRSHFLEG